MNDACRLRRLGPIPNGPLAYLVWASGKEASKVQRLPHRYDDFWQSGLNSEILAFRLGFFVSHAGKALLEADGNRQDRVACSMLLNPLGDLAEMLVLLPDVVFLTQVDEVYDWLCRKEK
jgi:hypothetical protein